MADKYSAVWLSYSSISDFLKCPRAYYLKNIYKDKKTGNKIQIITPPLAFGQAIHEVIESLSEIPTDKRFTKPLHERLDKAWKKVEGERGGFTNSEVEQQYKERGVEILDKIRKSPGPLKRLAIKIEMDLPHYWLDEGENLILCGKVDWLEYLEKEDAVHIIDFKTGQDHRENADSLQLPIYHLLVKNCQKRDVAGASYWYVEQSDEPVEKTLPSLEESHEQVMKIAKKVKLARQLESFECPKGEDGCHACKPYERILDGQGKFIYTDDIRRDVYILPDDDANREGTIL